MAVIKLNHTTQKMKFSIKDLVTFTRESFNGKLHFLSNARFSFRIWFFIIQPHNSSALTGKDLLKIIEDRLIHVNFLELNFN